MQPVTAGVSMKAIGLQQVFAVLCTLSLAAGQSSSKKGILARPGVRAYITRYYIEEPSPGSTYETGPLHVLFSDGTHVVQNLPPKEKSTQTNIVFNQEGFSDVQLAEDRKTIGWTETYDNCGTSYAVPLFVVIYRSGKIVQRIHSAQMVWSWMFFDRGKRVAVVWGPTHGPEVGDYMLYDVRTGKLLAEVYGDAETQALKPDAPPWAKQLEGRLMESN
jgi:hypothetical protein